MSVTFEFNLSNDDTDRLFAIKESQGKDQLTGNDFARELLEKELHRLHPKRVVFDEESGEIVS